MSLLPFKNPALRARALLGVGVITIAAWIPAPVRASPPEEVIAKWRITSVLEPIDITSRNEKEARQLLGHVIDIRNDGARLDDYKCAEPDFETKRVEPNMYLQEYAGISPKKLRLPNPVTVVDVSCTQVFIKNTNHVVIFWDGWFFEATKVKR